MVDVFQQTSSGPNGSGWSPSSDLTLTRQSLKRYADLPWVSLEIKSTLWEKQQGFSYFWMGYSPAQNLINWCPSLKSGSCNIVNWSWLCTILCTDKILIWRLRGKKLSGTTQSPSGIQTGSLFLAHPTFKASGQWRVHMSGQKIDISRDFW